MKTTIQILAGFIPLLLGALYMDGLSFSVWAHETKDIAPVKSVRAVPATPKPPRIDGLLDDEVWRSAPIATGFTQRDPDEGKPATEETAFQVAYDDEALHIGVLCYDSEPDKIVTRLYRRDGIRYGETDWLGIRLDPHHDHQTGFGFAVTPSGSVADNVIINDSRFDGSWDSVWEVRTAIHDRGWSVEFKIPYHALRFSPKEEYTWGINLERRVIRKQEYSLWVFVPKNETGISSRNGHLQGIRGIHPPTHLEFLPYTVAWETFEPKDRANQDGRDFFSGLGMDIRYGITSNISLNATLNPDFGQVEADPAVLNLTVFETFFQERRPFFVEGAGIFQTPFQLFYSRRIGKQPSHFGLPPGAEVVRRPESTTILGAAKITGKTRSKTSFGIMEAVTAPEYATVRRTVKDSATGVERAEQRKHLIEPLTNSFVGRVQQDLLDGNSTVGALITSVLRQDAEPAHTGGVDWNLKWKKNAYGFSGQIAGSRAGRFGARQNGYASSLTLGKLSGWLTSTLEFQALSPGFDPSDLGFIGRANRLNSWAEIGLRKNRPWGPFRRMSVLLAHAATWNYDAVNLDSSLNLWVGSEFRNYWRLDAYLYRDLQSLNDWKTRGGPLIVDPDSVGYDVTISTDERKPVSANVKFFWVPTKEVPQKYLGVGLRLQPTSALQLSVSPSYRWTHSAAEWVTNVDDGDGNDHFVFGELTTNQLNVTTRATITLTPRLSLQLYMQSFVAVGNYENFKELTRPRS